MSDETFQQLCKRLEHYETDPWAARAILKHEILTRRVVDPCCGTGILGKAAEVEGYDVFYSDIHDYGMAPYICDFLEADEHVTAQVRDATVMINPPFSLAVDFVLQAMRLEARKVVCFQRFAWWESDNRKEFWATTPPNRIYVCGDRATCWRHDIPVNEAGQRYDAETGKLLSSSPTPHAFFVWEDGHPVSAPLLGHIRKADLE